MSVCSVKNKEGLKVRNKVRRVERKKEKQNLALLPSLLPWSDPYALFISVTSCRKGWLAPDCFHFRLARIFCPMCTLQESIVDRNYLPTT